MRHGGKTIILARFVPIIRTFAPFVAGVGSMTYGRFAMFNVVGGIGTVLFIQVGGVLFDEVGPHAPFVFVGIGNLLIMGLALWGVTSDSSALSQREGHVYGDEI